MKMKMIKLFLAGGAVFLISCNTGGNAGLEQTVNEIKDSQQVILKKMEALDKTLANLALTNKSKPADKKQQPPKADPNKVYNVEVGNSFTLGPANAKVTMIEWTDFQ